GGTPHAALRCGPGGAPPRFRTIKVCPKDLPANLRHAERAAKPTKCSTQDRQKQFGSAVGAAAQGVFLRSAMRDIAEWLASIGLGEYAQRFADNAIDLWVIPDLTEPDLNDLGVLL